MKQLIASALLTAAAALSAQSQALPPPFPRTNATQLLENDRIRVWDIVWPAGQPTAMHRHIYDQVGTYYIAGGRKITQADGEVRTNFTEVGSLSTTKKGTTHIEEGTTNPPLRAVFIEMKQERGSGQPPVDIGGPAPFPREGAKQLLDDERVAVWDTTWGAGGAKGFRYRAARETVIVFLGDGTLRVTEHGASSTTAVRPGTMRHLARGDDSSLEITAGSPRVMFFEFR